MGNTLFFKNGSPTGSQEPVKAKMTNLASVTWIAVSTYNRI